MILITADESRILHTLGFCPFSPPFYHLRNDENAPAAPSGLKSQLINSFSIFLLRCPPAVHHSVRRDGEADSTTTPVSRALPLPSPCPQPGFPLSLPHRLSSHRRARKQPRRFSTLVKAPAHSYRLTPPLYLFLASSASVLAALARSGDPSGLWVAFFFCC
ncbi:unnamed protein product [Urochloa humidicola]